MGNKGIRNLAKANRSDLMGDLGFTQNQMDSIFGNLMTTGAGIARTLTKTQARELAAMRRTVTRGTTQSKASLARTREGIATRYGSATAGAVRDSAALAPARATGRAVGVGGRAGLQAGKILGAGGMTALQIQQGSVVEAAAGAEYALATAVAYRAKQDAAALAEKRLAFQITRIENEHDLEMQEDAQAHDLLMLEKTIAAQEEEAAGAQAAVTSALAFDVAHMMPDVHNLVETGASKEDIVSRMTLALGGETVPGAAQAAERFYQTLSSRGILTNYDEGKGVTWDVVAEALTDALVTSRPDINWTDKLKETTEARIREEIAMAWRAKQLEAARQRAAAAAEEEAAAADRMPLRGPGAPGGLPGAVMPGVRFTPAGTGGGSDVVQPGAYYKP